MLRYKLSQQRALRFQVLVRRGLNFPDYCTTPYIRLCHHKFSTHGQHTIRGECNTQQIFKKKHKLSPGLNQQLGWTLLPSEGCARGIAISCPAPDIFAQHLLP